MFQATDSLVVFIIVNKLVMMTSVYYGNVACSI